MQYPVLVEQLNGHFVATSVSVPTIRSEADSEEDAVSGVRTQLRSHLEVRKIVFIDLEPPGLLALFGKYRDDPTLTEICEEAYRIRDEEKRAEFGE